MQSKDIWPLSLFARLEILNRRIPTPPQYQIDPLRDPDPRPTIEIVFPLRLVAVLIHSMAVGYCGASALIKFDDEQFAALFNELQARDDKTKLMQLFGH